MFIPLCLVPMLPIWIIFTLTSYGHCNDTCEKKNQYCNCDANCVSYGDCCPSHEAFGKPGQLVDIITCKKLSKSRENKIWVIDKCKNNSHSLVDFCLKKKLENNKMWKSHVPVISKNSIVYENKYCAVCNGETKYIYSNVSFGCLFGEKPNYTSQNELFTKYLISKSCNIDPIFVNEQTRICYDNLIQNCPETFLDDDRKLKENCANGSLGITSGRQNYKNLYCCQCWNDTCNKFSNPQSTLVKFSYMFNFNEWRDDDDDIKVIENDSSLKQNQMTPNVMENLLFYSLFAFTILSIISLTFLIILYIVKDIFHNFGGYLTICLSFCMCLMNIITLLVTNTTIVQSNFCTPLAIIQHFMSISTFVWMSFYALDLLQTFGFKSFNVGKKKSLKTFGIYCIIGFGISSILVGTSTVIEFNMGDNSTIKPEYGGAHCWFTNKYGGIIWYFIPVCLMLMWNFGTCVVVFYRLIETSKECSVVQKRESNSTLWLCIRLTAVFGIGYFFQILVVLTKNDKLILFGSTINCLQGFLLTICFACTKRVKSLMTKTLSSWKGDHVNIAVSGNLDQRKTTTLSMSSTEKIPFMRNISLQN